MLHAVLGVWQHAPLRGRCSVPELGNLLLVRLVRIDMARGHAGDGRHASDGGGPLLGNLLLGNLPHALPKGPAALLPNRRKQSARVTLGTAGLPAYLLKVLAHHKVYRKAHASIVWVARVRLPTRGRWCHVDLLDTTSTKM